MRHTTARVTHVIEQLGYDWDAFEINHFVAVIADRFQRQIRIIPMQCAPGISAIWIHTSKCEFIFFRQDAPAVLQVHSILHETGHIALGHRGYAINAESLNTWLERIAASKSTIDDTPQEAEAEQFAVEVSIRVRRARQAAMMTRCSIAALQPYLDSGL